MKAEPSHRAWFFVGEQELPERWRHRAVPGYMIPLLPAEADGILEEGATEPKIDPELEPLLALIAEGLPIADMAGRLNLTERSVNRRLASLRSHFGVSTTARLSALLAERGFGWQR